MRFFVKGEKTRSKPNFSCFSFVLAHLENFLIRIFAKRVQMDSLCPTKCFWFWSTLRIKGLENGYRTIVFHAVSGSLLRKSV